ncbi:MAG: hypothetical protein RBU29_04855 [bacterium]|nr:hypothetical protein [bacterium]
MIRALLHTLFSIFILHFTYGDIISNQKYYGVTMRPLLDKFEITLCDFNGDSCDDIIFNNSKQYLFSLHNAWKGDPEIFLTLADFTFRLRGVIHPYFSFVNEKYASHHFKESRDGATRELLAFAYNNTLKIIGYMTDPFFREEFSYFTKDVTLPIEDRETVQAIYIDSFYNSSLLDVLLIIASEDQPRAILCHFFSSMTSKLDIEETHLLKSLPLRIHTAHLNTDATPDLMMEYPEGLLIWLVDENGGFSPNRPELNHFLPFPHGYQNVTSIMPNPFPNVYCLFAVHQEDSNDSLLLALKSSVLDGSFHLETVPFPEGEEILSQSTHTFFSFREDDRTIPILISGKPYEFGSMANNPYTIYQMDETLEFVPIQIFDIDPFLDIHNPESRLYLNRPLAIGDLNGDGTSDVLFSLVRENPTNPVPADQHHQNIVIFSGQPQTTAIPAREWMRQD